MRPWLVIERPETNQGPQISWPGTPINIKRPTGRQDEFGQVWASLDASGADLRSQVEGGHVGSADQAMAAKLDEDDIVERRNSIAISLKGGHVSQIYWFFFKKKRLLPRCKFFFLRSLAEWNRSNIYSRIWRSIRQVSNRWPDFCNLLSDGKDFPSRVEKKRDDCLCIFGKMFRFCLFFFAVHSPYRRNFEPTPTNEQREH